MQTERPPASWHHSVTGLADFAMLTWGVDPGGLASHLPAGIEPDERDGAAYVSMVAFTDVDFRFRFAPWARVRCGQVNYRAYVRRGDETGVWFFGTTLDSPFVALPRLAWQMPWHRARTRITAAWLGDRCERWSIGVDGRWGAARVVVRGRGVPVEPVPGFGTDHRTHVLDPDVGWYRRSDGAVGRYSVWHEPLELEAAVVERAECHAFADLGLIRLGDPPVRAGVCRAVEFDVHTPPRRGAEPARAGSAA